MVPRLPVARDTGGGGDALRCHDEGGFLAALVRHANERAADQVAQPTAGWVRGQAHQQQVGRHCEVLARHRTARHQRAGGARDIDEDAGGRTEYGL